MALARFTFYLKIKLTAFADGLNAVVEKERRERRLKNKTVGTVVAAMSLSSKTRWDPGCSLRQPWDKADPAGRGQEGGRRVRWGARCRGGRICCPRAEGSGSQLRVGDGVGAEDSGQGRLRLLGGQERERTGSDAVEWERLLPRDGLQGTPQTL